MQSEVNFPLPGLAPQHTQLPGWISLQLSVNPSTVPWPTMDSEPLLSSTGVRET